MTRLPMFEISEVFDKWAKEIKIPTRDIMFTMDRIKDNEITIYTDRPGLMIGKAGCTIDKLKTALNAKVDEHNEIIRRCSAKPDREFTLEEMPYVSINFVETVRADYWLNYSSMGECF